MMKYGFENQIKRYQKRAQILIIVESTHNRINYQLNQLMVEFYCRLNLPAVAKVKESQSQKSKIVKPTGAVGF